jgi:hypothetical protein
MAIANNVRSFKDETEVAKAAGSIQPASFNGVNFKKTNLYDNNEAHTKVIEFAKNKAGDMEADSNGIRAVEVNGYTVRLYGDKPELSTSGFVDLV